MKRLLLTFALILMTASPAFADETKDKDGDTVFSDKDSYVVAEEIPNGELRYVVRHNNGEVRSFKSKKDAIKDAKGKDS